MYDFRTGDPVLLVGGDDHPPLAAEGEIVRPTDTFGYCEVFFPRHYPPPENGDESCFCTWCIPVEHLLPLQDISELDMLEEQNAINLMLKSGL
jgi:hypothetical protein